ncbi:DUF3298 and DUF4163 domain-containing protein [uncultured Clostridium sp.]|uniref:DUF3298 and DUF4163 domain-containing protein n=1 Tax=uncultured Clostridium sp. TaxID=59620 RepID=UPI002601D574|nr:DUF3298 and DUF4163 domain-containing protein [uncultured Clostridium sp.]
MKKKVALLVILFCFILGVHVLATERYLDIDSKNTIKKSANIDINIKNPIVKSKSKIVKSIFDKINNENKKWSEGFIKEANLDKFDPKYEVNSSFHVPYNNNDILSLNVMNYYYAGGAHGLNNLISYNYNVKTGEELKLKSLFVSSFDYKTHINEKIKSYISLDKDTYFSGGADFKGISDNQEFYISNEGITVYFQVYKIAPYAAGIRYFLIPKAEIEPYLVVKF